MKEKALGLLGIVIWKSKTKMTRCSFGKQKNMYKCALTWMLFNNEGNSKFIFEHNHILQLKHL